jgi:alpha,alpha-trehalase
MRESGHDTSYRWFDARGDRCADFASVDLNVLLLRYELDIAGWLPPERAAEWCQRAANRASLLSEYLWDEEKGLFLDFDLREQRRHHYVGATTLYPLWLGGPNACGIQVVSRVQAQRLVRAALPLLEELGGLAATARESLARVSKATLTVTAQQGATSRELGRQWDYPNGWAPHQMLVWEGLRRHGFAAEADRLTYRWLYMIAKNSADYHGTVPEKFNVQTRSHQVFEEYGNVNTDFAYITEEGFGWMNASFMVGWNQLSTAHRAALEDLVAPEVLFAQSAQ